MYVKTCKCGGETRVTDIRERKQGIIWRRRMCLSCGDKITTYEVADWYLEALESKAKYEESKNVYR